MSFEVTTATAAITDEQILNSLDAGFRTENGIRMRTGCRPDVIDEKLLDMIADDKIKRFEYQGNSAFFRYDERPVRIWLAGGGRTGVEWSADLEDEKTDMNTAVVSNGNGKHSRQPIAWTPEAVEKAFAENSSNSKVGQAIGMSEPTVTKKYNADVNFRAAADRGKAKRTGDAVPKRGAKKGAIKAIPAKTQSRKEEPEIIVPQRRYTKQDIMPFRSVDRIQNLEGNVSHRHITLERGGQFMIAFEGSVFDLTPDEFALISAVSVQIDQFNGKA